LKFVIGLLLFIVTGLTAGRAEIVHHDIDIKVDRVQGVVAVTDRVTLPAVPSGEFSFSLAAGARITASSIPVISESQADKWFRSYSLRWPSGTSSWQIRFQLPWPGDNSDYLWLDSSLGWYPLLSGGYAERYPLLQFDLRADLPSGWHAISQGQRVSVPDHNGPANQPRFAARQPQQTIEFVAAPFHVYQQPGPIPAFAYLLQADQELASRYLGATSRYIDLYQSLLGPYPYHQFTLVENPEQTGYGMPAFTLLGSRVIRLPFIIDSSYPHEILHNWWGNSVYVAERGGNWSEGLTAYMADHYLKEQQGMGAAYRRDALQAYRDYVGTERDFPLTQFRARHDRASQAVGYNKTLMLFHMLRRRLGDKVFYQALRNFYRDYKFQLAGFNELRTQFEEAGKVDLQGMFSQWVERIGAPQIALGKVVQIKDGPQNQWQVELRQLQPGPAYDLLVPAVFAATDGSALHREDLVFKAHAHTYQLSAPAGASQLRIDPYFDLFRILDPSEAPAGIGAVLGSGHWVFVLPRKASAEQQTVYREFAALWQDAATVVWDDQAIPANKPLWLLGWDNRLLSQMRETLPSGVVLSWDKLRLENHEVDPRRDAVVLAGRSGSTPWLWSATPQAGAISSQRLPHYGKYSYVVFAQGRPVVRGQWPVLDSILAVALKNNVKR